MANKQPFSKEQQDHITRHVKHHVEKHVEKRLSEQLLTKAEFLAAQFKQHVSTAVIAAFSFLMALTWKDLIVKAITTFIKEEIIHEAPYLAELISAIIVTLIALLGIMVVALWARRPHVIVSETCLT